MKGGVGKTTIAIGQARALEARGFKVGLLDLDIHGSSVPRALELERDTGYDPLLGGRLRPVQVDGFQLFPIGLLYREGTPNMWHGEDKESAVKQIVSGCVAWDGGLEWLVVDTRPTGARVMASGVHPGPPIVSESGPEFPAATNTSTPQWVSRSPRRWRCHLRLARSSP